jgi:hypothetical protein
MYYILCKTWPGACVRPGWLFVPETDQWMDGWAPLIEIGPSRCALDLKKTCLSRFLSLRSCAGDSSRRVWSESPHRPGHTSPHESRRFLLARVLGARKPGRQWGYVLYLSHLSKALFHIFSPYSFRELCVSFFSTSYGHYFYPLLLVERIYRTERARLIS